MIWYIFMAIFSAAVVATIATTIYTLFKHDHSSLSGKLVIGCWIMAILITVAGVFLSYRTAIGTDRVLFDSVIEPIMWLLFVVLRYSMYLGSPDERKPRKTGADK